MNREYHNNNRRLSALQRISDEMNIVDITICDIRLHLRTYMKEKRREETSKVSGAGTNQVYISNWKYFNELKFLNINSTESSFMQSSLMTRVDVD